MDICQIDFGKFFINKLDTVLSTFGSVKYQPRRFSPKQNLHQEEKEHPKEIFFEPLTKWACWIVRILKSNSLSKQDWLRNKPVSLFASRQLFSLFVSSQLDPLFADESKVWSSWLENGFFEGSMKRRRAIKITDVESSI